MANLVIKGHASRGKEVIEILKKLGGNTNAFTMLAGDLKTYGYYINSDGMIDFKHRSGFNNNDIIYSLEEFLEKFPYKVGDKVFAFGNKWTVVDAVWDGSIEEVVYTIKSDTSKYTTTKLSNQLQPCKEENFGECIKKTVQECLFGKDGSLKEIKIEIPTGYKFYCVDNDNGQVVLHYIQHEYPKSYEGCCWWLSLGEDGRLYTKGYKSSLIQDFQKLIICRDAYWKIAGEHMGLGTPWEPNWNIDSKFKYIISCRRDKIIKDTLTAKNSILAFPTEEMRDAFYDNFKDLIERCKTFL